MKYLLLCIVVLSGLLQAQLLTEQFNYTDSGTEGLAKQSSLWTNANTGDSILVSNGSLSYTGITTVGNKIAFGGAGVDCWRGFTSQTSGTVYYSFILKVTSLGSLDATGGYFTSFIQDASTTTFGATIWLRLDGAGFNIGVSKRTTIANISWSTTTRNVGESYFIVVAYEKVATTTTDDIVRLWVNPSLGLGSEPAADLTSTTTDTDLTSVARIMLRQDSSTETPDLEMDEITVATSWATATLPVEITSFSAVLKGKSVELIWSTATETNNYGFEVERSVNGQWSKIGFVQGSGTSSAPKDYGFVDAVSSNGKYSYRLKQIDRDGKFQYHHAIEVNVNNSVVDYELAQNFPNPFNPTTTIQFSVRQLEHATVKVYDLTGREVAELFNGMASPGEVYNVQFNSKGLASGIYFYVLQSQNFRDVKKMQLLK